MPRALLLSSQTQGAAQATLQALDPASRDQAHVLATQHLSRSGMSPCAHATRDTHGLTGGTTPAPTRDRAHGPWARLVSAIERPQCGKQPTLQRSNLVAAKYGGMGGLVVSAQASVYIYESLCTHVSQLYKLTVRDSAASCSNPTASSIAPNNPRVLLSNNGRRQKPVGPPPGRAPSQQGSHVITYHVIFRVRFDDVIGVWCFCFLGFAAAVWRARVRPQEGGVHKVVPQVPCVDSTY
jgi:hypothetical protein